MEVVVVGAEAAAAAAILLPGATVLAAAVGGAASLVVDRHPHLLEAMAAGLTEVEVIPLHPPLIGVAETSAGATATAHSTRATGASGGRASKRCLHKRTLCIIELL